MIAHINRTLGNGARPVEYGGIHFRSTTEARYAVLFDRLRLEWKYEPLTYKIGRFEYTPDFVVTSTSYRLRRLFSWGAEDDRSEWTHSMLKDCGVLAIEVKPTLDFKKILEEIKGNSFDKENFQWIKAWQLHASGAHVAFLTGDLFYGEEGSLGNALDASWLSLKTFSWRGVVDAIGIVRPESLQEALWQASHFRFNLPVRGCSARQSE